MSKKLTSYEKAEKKFIRELLKTVDGADQVRQICALIQKTQAKIRIAHDKKLYKEINGI